MMAINQAMIASRRPCAQNLHQNALSPRQSPILAILLLTTAVSCAPFEPPKPALAYPVTTKGDVVEDYHGTKVADPYRWMEDLDAKPVADWVAAQNAVTDPCLDALPLRKQLTERLTAL